MNNLSQRSFLDPGYTPPVRRTEPIPAPKLERSQPIGEQLRDEALERVSANAGPEFREQALAIVRTLSGEMTGEDIRCACEAQGVIPHHHNGWGAFIGGLVKRKILVETGRRIPMKAPDSHGRKTPVYRFAV